MSNQKSPFSTLILKSEIDLEGLVHEVEKYPEACHLKIWKETETEHIYLTGITDVLDHFFEVSRPLVILYKNEDEVRISRFPLEFERIYPVLEEEEDQ